MSKFSLAALFPALEVAVYLLLLPVALLAEPALLPALGVIPVMWGVNLWLFGRPWPRTRFNLALYLILFMIGVSLWATPDLALSLPKVVGLAFAIFFFWAAVSFCQTSFPSFLIGLSGYFGLAVGIVVVALLKTSWTAKIPGSGGVIALLNRLNGLAAPLPLPAINANQVAGVLMWVTPLAVGLTAALWALRRSKTQPAWPTEMRRLAAFWPLFFLVTLLFMGTLLLTQSRTGWAALGLALLAMGWLSGGRRRQAAVATVAVGVLAIGILALTANNGGPDNQILNLLGLQTNALVEGNAIGTLNGRLEIWSRAIYAIQDFPITGMGMNVFREVVHILYPLFLISSSTDIAHAHNHLLQTGVDLGIPGLIGYLAVWFGAAAIVWELWRSPLGRHPFWRPLLIGFAGSLLAYWLFGITDTVSLGAKPGFLWWLMLALLVGMEKLRSAES